MAEGGAAAPYVLLGVMSNPTKPVLREQWREWSGRFATAGRQVHVRYVFGETIYKPHVDPAQRTEALLASAAGGKAEADLLFVEGRERLPHVGVVTEKSGTFWRAAVAIDAHARWFCKCDDDTLVHLDRLHATLRYIEGKHRGLPVYFGHMKWRGWDVGRRFQACGGTWGDAPKTAEDILHGGVLHGATRYPSCPHAAGPYAYMSGGMVCMSRPLAQRMHDDRHFAAFLRDARARNTHGVPCKRPRACAAQPEATHMWHHEDAGVGYNVFRAVVAQNASMAYIPVPAHYNDPGIIERSSPLDANDQYWSTRAIFTHGIKTRAHYRTLQQRWNLSRPQAAHDLRCYPCDQLPPGTNKHYGHWAWARVPCPGTHDGDVEAAGVGRWCHVEPREHFTCCTFPWDIPADIKAEAKARLRDAKPRAARRGMKRVG